MKLAVHHFSVESEREGGDDVSEVVGGADVDGARLRCLFHAIHETLSSDVEKSMDECGKLSCVPVTFPLTCFPDPCHE